MFHYDRYISKESDYSSSRPARKLSATLGRSGGRRVAVVETRERRSASHTWAGGRRGLERPWVDCFSDDESGSGDDFVPAKSVRGRKVTFSDSEDDDVVHVSLDFSGRAPSTWLPMPVPQAPIHPKPQMQYIPQPMQQPMQRPMQQPMQHHMQQPRHRHTQPPMQHIMQQPMHPPMHPPMQQPMQQPMSAPVLYPPNAAVQVFDTMPQAAAPAVQPLVAHMPYQPQQPMESWTHPSTPVQVQYSSEKSGPVDYQVPPDKVPRYRQGGQKKREEDDAGSTSGNAPGAQRPEQRQWRKLVYYIPVDQDGNSLPPRAYHVRPEIIDELLKRGQEEQSEATPAPSRAKAN